MIRPGKVAGRQKSQGKVGRSLSAKTLFLLVLFVVQAGCAYFFVSDIVMSVFGLRTEPLSWHAREVQALGAAVGLILGVVLGALALWRSYHRTDVAERKLRLSAGLFMDHLSEKFDDWGLTPAERDVALFAVKGMSIQEIAQMRDTSEGTVKAQTYAIYRKAGVAGRPQLLSLFIEDLMNDALPSSPKSGLQPGVAAESAAARVSG